MKPRRVVVLLNGAAGTLQRGGAQAFRQSLNAAFARHELAAELRFVEPSRLAREVETALRQVEGGEFDAVLAGGGDGSISTVASAMLGRDVPLGVLPLGTLNHFAGDLGVPSDLDGAVGVVAAGETQWIDTGTLNGRTFVNNSSIGLYPYMVMERERTRRRTPLPKWLAMIWAGWRVLRFFPLRRLMIPAAGRAPYRSPCVFVGNNEYHLTGPALGRRLGLRDGRLSLYIADQDSRWALAKFAARLLLGRVDPGRDLTMLKLPEVEIHSRHRRRLLVALDGEIETIRTPLRYAIRPASLLVFAPAPAAKA